MPDQNKKLNPEEKKSHFRNLVVMALKDGRLAPSERDMPAFLAGKWGLTSAEADDVLAHPDKIKLSLPKTADAKFVQLYEITEMMIIDGVAGAQEKALRIGLAKEPGFRPEAIDILIEEILAGVNTVPRQVIAVAAHGGKTLPPLPHETSLLVYQDAKSLPQEVVTVNGLHVPGHSSLLKKRFGQHTVEMRGAPCKTPHHTHWRFFMKTKDIPEIRKTSNQNTG